MSERGPYRKSATKREEILAAALEIIARTGYRGASVKAIGEATGLSPAGVLHHFDTKERLFVEVLRARDKRDEARLRARREAGTDESPIRPLNHFAALMRSNTEVPGLVELYCALAVEAADPTHEAHDFFAERRVAGLKTLAGAVRNMQEAGRLTTRIDAESLATALHALADGLQLLWLVDPDVDMADVITSLLEALGTEEPDGAT